MKHYSIDLKNNWKEKAVLTDLQWQTVQLISKYLSGTWKGCGKGDYPTIEKFEYSVIFRVQQIQPRPLFHILQETRYSDSGEPLHIESGLIVVNEDGSIILNTAQDGGRVEIMEGKIESTEQGITVNFESKSFGNDERLIKTKRVYTLFRDILEFKMYMQTQKTEFTRHLESHLRRTADIPALIL